MSHRRISPVEWNLTYSERVTEQAGLFVTARVGTGLVVARKRGGGWSAPSALGSFGLGWGFQVGGEVSEGYCYLGVVLVFFRGCVFPDIYARRLCCCCCRPCGFCHGMQCLLAVRSFIASVRVGAVQRPHKRAHEEGWGRGVVLYFGTLFFLFCLVASCPTSWKEVYRPSFRARGFCVGRAWGTGLAGGTQVINQS